MEKEKIVQLLEQVNDKMEKIVEQQNCLINLALLNQRIQWLFFYTLSEQHSDPLAQPLASGIDTETLWNDELEKLLSRVLGAALYKK